MEHLLYRYHSCSSRNSSLHNLLLARILVGIVKPAERHRDTACIEIYHVHMGRERPGRAALIRGLKRRSRTVPYSTVHIGSTVVRCQAVPLVVRYQ